MVNKELTEVACAVILREGMLLAAQRHESDPHHPLKWELPGGKVEDGESAEACIKRELLEELGVMVEVMERLPETVHGYRDKWIRLIPFKCRIVSGIPQVIVHQQLKWVGMDVLLELDWVEADLPIIRHF